MLALALWKSLTDMFLPPNKIHLTVIISLFAPVGGILLGLAAIVRGDLETGNISQRVLDAFLWITGLLAVVVLFVETYLAQEYIKKR